MSVHDRPTADELLAIARETVLRELLPQLPPGAHYAARMVANAIAIARREQQSPALPVSLAAQLERLAGGNADGTVSWPERLTQRIRAGAFDGDPVLARELRNALERWTALRVEVSNPRLLDQPPA